ncbi:MAG: delta-60 repeat domain-containing protein [Lysobacterales bacterium]
MRTRKFGNALLLGTLLAAAAAQAAPADGDFDTNWGFFNSGKMIVPFDFGGDQVDVAADSVLGDDGSLFIAGTVKDANGIKRMGVTKLTPAGGIDTAGFGGGDGRVLSPSNAGVMHATGIARRGTTLYVGGFREVDATNRDFALCIFNTSGVPLLFLSTSSPCVTASFDLGNTISQDIATSMVVQPDGKIVLAGTTAVNSATDTYAAFVRFKSNGALDNTFGVGGTGQQLLRTTNVFQRHRINAVTLAGNGKIVAVGSTDPVGASDTSALVIRLKSDGLVDALSNTAEYAFSVDGSNQRDTGLYDVIAVDNPTDAEDDLVVVGYAELANSIHSGLIAKLNLAYALDTVGFSAGDGSDGYYTTINNASWDFNSVAIQPGVGYVIGATIAQNDQTDFMLGRFRFDGKIDTLWTSQSTAFHPFDFGLNGQFDLLADVKVQGDGIYAVGTGFKTPTNTDFVAAKLTLDRIFRDRFE